MADSAPEQLPPEFYAQPLTARMLEDFGSCPHKFLLSFFATDTDDRRLRGGAAALHQAARQALMDLYALGGPSSHPLAELRAAFERHWDGSRCGDSLEEEQLHRTGLDLLGQYHAAHEGDPRTFVAADVHLTGEVAGQQFVAVADLVLCTENGANSVLRLRTTRRPLSAAELRTDLSAQLFWLLATDHLRAAGAAGVEVLYYFLRQGRAQEVILDSEQAAYLQTDLAAQVGRIHREQQFTPRKGPYCRWCRSRARCPLWRR